MFMISIGCSDVLYALDVLIFCQPGLIDGRWRDYHLPYSVDLIYTVYTDIIFTIKAVIMHLPDIFDSCLYPVFCY